MDNSKKTQATSNELIAHSCLIDKQIVDLILLTAPVIIILTNKDGKIKYANPAVRTIFGYYEGEIEGKDLSWLIPSLETIQYDSFETVSDRGELDLFIEKIPNSPEPKSNTDTQTQSGYNYLERFLYGKKNETKKNEIEVQNKTGFTFWIDLYANKIKAADCIFYVFIANDITENKQQQAQIICMNDDLEQRTYSLAAARDEALAASRTKSAFLANMSHEIRTPLNAIIGFSDMLLDPDQTDDERKDIADTIVQNSHRLLGIIDSVLDMTKIESGKLEIERLHFSPLQILIELETTLKIQTQAKDIDFSIEYLYPLPTTIFNDPTKIKQILVNLCNNAIKFTESGSISITVSCDQESGAINFLVTDTGIGMTAQQIEKIFDAFVQADDSSTRRFGGTGLGLAICKRLTQALGGSLHVDSSPNNGSRFTATIATGPLDNVKWLHNDTERTELTKSWQNDDSIRPASEPAFTNSVHTSNYAKTASQTFSARIMYAEDNEFNQRLITRMLRHTKIELTLVSNGEEAVEKALLKDFDLILLAIKMPVMDGLEAIKLLISTGFVRPIIALTENVTIEDLEAYKKIGFAHAISKPIEQTQFFETIRVYLGNIANNQDASNWYQEDEDIDPEYQELAQQFLHQFLPNNLEQLEIAKKTQNHVEMQTIAHRIKATASNFKFNKISAIADAIEAKIKAGNYDECESLIPALLAESIKTASLQNKPMP